jgi:hypothetical protein
MRNYGMAMLPACLPFTQALIQENFDFEKSSVISNAKNDCVKG